MLAQRIDDKNWFNRTVQDLFVETCSVRQDKTAIVYKEEHISYTELQQNVNKVSSALIELGVQSGDRITVLPTTTKEFVYVYLGILQIGAIVNPINLLWGVQEFKSILERNDPKLIITVDEHKGKNFIELIRKSIPDLKYTNNQNILSENIKSLTNIISVSEQSIIYDGIMDFHYLFNITKDNDKEIANRMEQQKCTDIQFICQTSGSTGLSKGALWNHRPPLASANFFIKNVMFNENDSYINLSPFFHNSGILSIVLNLAYAGTTLYLLEEFNPKEALKMIDKHGITCTVGFSAHWRGLKSVLDESDYKFTIRKGALAGDPNTYDVVREMCGGSNKVSMIYAQTENGPLVSMGEHDCMLPEVNKFSNGRSLPGVEVIIRDIETDQVLNGKQGGEICYKSPYMFKGYYKQEEETNKSFDKEGYFRSGDFGTFEHGFIRYLGRIDGVVKSGGENVSLFHVSSQLIELFPNEIEDVHTLGINDNYWGKKIVSFIKLKQGIDHFSLVELKQRCKGEMADYEIPKEIFFWEKSWPTTGEGKVDIEKLTTRAEGLLTNKI